MTDLSPAAKAVLDAIGIPVGSSLYPVARGWSAAALRAVADQVVPESEPPQRDGFSDRSVWQWAVDCHNQDVGTRSKLLAIAAELEGKQ